MAQGQDLAALAGLSADELARMHRAAWLARAHAHVYSGIKVGAAALAASGDVFAGCNVEHRFRAHDVHAEVNAIASLVAAGHHELKAVLVVSKEAQFTPCGGCMDWIYELGGPECVVFVANDEDEPALAWRAAELMPHYPHQ